jgi:hypothetical protein
MEWFKLKIIRRSAQISMAPKTICANRRSSADDKFRVRRCAFFIEGFSSHHSVLNYSDKISPGWVLLNSGLSFFPHHSDFLFVHPH